MRIATYNVHRCIGRDGRLDVERCARVLAEMNADVVGLQEVDANHRGPESGDALLLAAEAMGYRVIHGITMARPDADYGNALLVKGGTRGIRQHDISLPGREPRGVIEAQVDLEGRALQVFVTHLGLRARERRVQAGRLAALIADRQHPTVVMGDFNEWRPFARTFRVLHERFGYPPSKRSFPAWRPFLALDRIWIHPLEALHTITTHRSSLARQASDHLPVLAQIALSPTLDGEPIQA